MNKFSRLEAFKNLIYSMIIFLKPSTTSYFSYEWKSKPEICRGRERNQGDPGEVQYCQVRSQKAHLRVRTAADKD